MTGGKPIKIITNRKGAAKVGFMRARDYIEGMPSTKELVEAIAKRSGAEL